jgi:hypothetical protein
MPTARAVGLACHATQEGVPVDLYADDSAVSLGLNVRRWQCRGRLDLHVGATTMSSLVVVSLEMMESLQSDDNDVCGQT